MRRTILITGAAKRLGAALAKGLAQDGHRIAIHFRSSKAEAEETLAQIHKAGGDAALFQSALADLSQGEQLVKEIVQRFGGLDTLINSAGTFPRKSFEETTQEDWNAGLTSTATAAFVATRAALPSLRASGCGRIINIGDSMSDRIGFADIAMSYYIGKLGVWLMTRTLATSEARHKITVNMVSPGVLENSMNETPIANMPLGRFGTTEDVLRPIRFLLEPASEALTGGWNLT
jgi:3-oxoacyl-[acyl-carrier protein] reductase